MTREKDFAENQPLFGNQKKSEIASELSTDRVIAEPSVGSTLDGDDKVGAHTTPTPQSDQSVPNTYEDTCSTADTDPIRRTSKQRKNDLNEYRATFLPVPRIKDRKPVFVSSEVRDKLDRIVRLLGERGMSVSGLVENIALHHLSVHEADIEHWRKM